MKTYHITTSDGSKDKQSYTEEAIIAMWNNGILTSDRMVWVNGNWMKIEKFLKIKPKSDDPAQKSTQSFWREVKDVIVENRKALLTTAIGITPLLIKQFKKK